jgi:transposase
LAERRFERQVRDFARATGRLAKTDRLDAEVLALFGEAVRPEARPLANEQAQALEALVTRRRQLVEMLTAEKNRRTSAECTYSEPKTRTYWMMEPGEDWYRSAGL